MRILANGTRPPMPGVRKASLGCHRGAILLLLSAGLLTGCGEIGIGQWIKPADGTGAKGGLIGTEAANDTTVSDSVPARLADKSFTEVRSVLGQPLGRLRTQSGSVWLYAEWRVEFDAEGRVASVAAEQPVRVAGGPLGDGAPGSVPAVTVISRGGFAVDVWSMLPPGKVAIVDFYADWCGPCGQITPHLEELANNDPEVVLIKIDIVKWDTPVTRQYQIRSVPNIRVYNRQKVVVGSPTSDLNTVLRYVHLAKK